jgi:hypothetical protein
MAKQHRKRQKCAQLAPPLAQQEGGRYHVELPGDLVAEYVSHDDALRAKIVADEGLRTERALDRAFALWGKEMAAAAIKLRDQATVRVTGMTSINESVAELLLERVCSQRYGCCWRN